MNMRILCGTIIAVATAFACGESALAGLPPQANSSVTNAAAAEGNISLDLTIDYLHPTAKGYDLWAAALAPIIEKECGAAVQKITQSKQ